MRSIAYFPTFKRKYYFSNSFNGKLLLKQFYQPYGFLTSLFCLFWDRAPFVDRVFTTSIVNLPININTIQSILGWKNIDFVLCGGAGTEKKITGLCINKDTDEKVFFKYGSSNRAVQLIKNEINILNSLSLPIIPSLLYSGKETNQDVWFITESFEGIKYNKIKVSSNIFSLILQINKAEFLKKKSSHCQLIYVFSHGDFCPWNLVINLENNIKVIDWEMAGWYPLGFDLFTFIFQSSFLLSPNKKPVMLIKENLSWFNQYFSSYGVDNYLPYLKEFSFIKFKMEHSKNNVELIQAYKNLIKAMDFL